MDTVHSWWGLLVSVFAIFGKHDEEIGTGRLTILFVLLVIQVVVFGVILCVLGVVYMLGMYISAGVSVWRLIEHDFGKGGGDNKKPALDALYILAAVQGALFGYKTIYGLVSGSRLADVVAGDCIVDREVIEEYLEETVAGCEKNISFASGRNFVTYGVDLMVEAKSNEGFIAGIKVLGGIINCESSDDGLLGRIALAKYLLTRTDSSRTISQRLIEAVDPRSPCSREIKEHVVRILDIIVRSIPWEQLPRAIECLCSVVDQKYEEEYTEDDMEDMWDRRLLCGPILSDIIPEWLYKCLPSMLKQLRDCFLCKREKKVKKGRVACVFDPLLTKATDVIHKLVVHEDNRWIMRTCVSSTLLHKIAMFPRELHRKNHEPCRANEKSELQMLEQCWVLTEWLLVALVRTSSPPLLSTATPVGEGPQRRSSEGIEEVEEGEEQLGSMDGSTLESTIKHTIKESIQSTIKSIFGCLNCGPTQKRQAIQILLHLFSTDQSSMNNWMSFIVKDSESRKRRLSWILLLIFCSTDDDSKYWMVPSLSYPNNNCCDFDSIRRLAGKKLSEMLQGKRGELPSEQSATELLQSIHLAHEDLESACNADSEDISMRQHASIIKKGLSHRAYLIRVSELQGLVDAVPEVVTEKSIPCGSFTAESQEAPVTDLEMGNVS